MVRPATTIPFTFIFLAESVKKQILKTRIPSNALSVSDGLEAAGHSLSFKKSALFAAVSTAELPFELGWGSTLGSYWN